jgi:hypothetical protein
MDEAVGRFADARIREFVPILAQKDAIEVLRRLGPDGAELLSPLLAAELLHKRGPRGVPL